MGGETLAGEAGAGQAWAGDVGLGGAVRRWVGGVEPFGEELAQLRAAGVALVGEPVLECGLEFRLGDRAAAELPLDAPQHLREPRRAQSLPEGDVRRRG